MSNVKTHYKKFNVAGSCPKCAAPIHEGYLEFREGPGAEMIGCPRCKVPVPREKPDRIVWKCNRCAFIEVFLPLDYWCDLVIIPAIPAHVCVVKNEEGRA